MRGFHGKEHLAWISWIINVRSLVLHKSFNPDEYPCTICSLFYTSRSYTPAEVLPPTEQPFFFFDSNVVVIHHVFRLNIPAASNSAHRLIDFFFLLQSLFSNEWVWQNTYHLTASQSPLLRFVFEREYQLHQISDNFGLKSPMFKLPEQVDLIYLKIG